MNYQIPMMNAILIALAVGGVVYFLMSQRKTTSTSTPAQTVIQQPQVDPQESMMKWLTFLNELKSPPKEKEISELDKFHQIADLIKKVQIQNPGVVASVQEPNQSLQGVKDVMITFKPATIEAKDPGKSA